MISRENLLIRIIVQAKRAIKAEIRQLKLEMEKGFRHMSVELDNLKAAMSALITEATGDLEAVIAQIGAAPSDAADLQALADQANAAVVKLKADMAALTGAPVPPPAA